MRRLSRRLRISVMLFAGAYLTPLPFRHPIFVAMGAPVQMPKVENPTAEQIDAAHARFVARLSELYYARRHMAPGYENKELEIV